MNSRGIRRKRDLWDVLPSIAAIIASIGVPLSLGLSTHVWQSERTQQESSAKLVEIGIGILREDMSGVRNTEGLYTWAAEVVSLHSGRELSSEAASVLRVTTTDVEEMLFISDFNSLFVKDFLILYNAHQMGQKDLGEIAKISDLNDQCECTSQSRCTDLEIVDLVTEIQGLSDGEYLVSIIDPKPRRTSGRSSQAIKKINGSIAAITSNCEIFDTLDSVQARRLRQQSNTDGSLDEDPFSSN